MTKRCTDGSPSEKGRQIACICQSRAHLVPGVGQGPQGFPGRGDQAEGQSLQSLPHSVINVTGSGSLGIGAPWTGQSGRSGRSPAQRGSSTKVELQSPRPGTSLP